MTALVPANTTDPSLLAAAQTATKLLDRKTKDFVKDDLLAIILALDPIKWTQITSASTACTVEELRFIIRELTLNPNRIQNAIQLATASSNIIKN